MMPRDAAEEHEMPSGGARVNSGPPPDPNALRRDRPNDRDGWTLLPSAGRQGKAPTWPLEDPTPRELKVWAQIWATPQAVAWQRLAWSHDVALYVRFLVIAEGGVLGAAGEVRQWSDRLGLNPSAMLRNRWKVAPDELGARREAPAAVSDRPSARDRLRADA